MTEPADAAQGAASPGSSEPDEDRVQASASMEMPKRRRIANLQSWQVVLAAGVTVVGSLVGTLVTTYGASSSSGEGASEVPRAASQQTGSPAPPETAFATPSYLSIVSVSWLSVPPPPRERFVFNGTIGVSDGSETGIGRTVYDSIFVIARPAATAISSAQEWMVSPPARLLGDGRWVIYWTMDRPPANVIWTAVYITSAQPVGAQYFVKVGSSGKQEIVPYVPPGYWEGYEDVLKKYGLTGTFRQMSPYGIIAVSKPWSVRR